jgi:hypothetical protein
MIIKGSNAMNAHIPNYKLKPKDIDIIGTEDEILDYCDKMGIWKIKKERPNITSYHGNANGVLYDFEVAEKNRSSVDYLNIMNNIEGETKIASLEVMYSIHRAIVHFDINREKKIRDYNTLKQIVKEDILENITYKLYSELVELHHGKIKIINFGDI